MPSDCCYFVDKAAAAAAASALKYFDLFYTALRCLHKIWDRPKSPFPAFVKRCREGLMNQSEIDQIVRVQMINNIASQFEAEFHEFR